jgi:hypothetical protein
MKVSAKERGFNLFERFLFDLHDAEGVSPFDEDDLVKKLNELAERLAPDCYIEIVASDISSWSLLWNESRTNWAKNPDKNFKVFPGTTRVYDERAFRRSLPAQLDEVLLDLNEAVVIL